MTTLKKDLINELESEKYYLESDFVRYAQKTDIGYKEKINTMIDILKRISKIDTSIGLVHKYFQQPQPKEENKE